MASQFILLCKGNQGKLLIQQNLLQIRLYQLPKITRSQILKQYIRVAKPSQLPINLITKKRNYYIDSLLSKDQQLILTNNQQLEGITSSKVQLPLELQIIYPDEKYLIESLVDVDLVYFNILQKIGQGTFAEIFLAEQKYDRRLVCIKRVHKLETIKKGSKVLLRNQFTALKYRHQHKINLMYMFQNAHFVFFVTEFCVFRDLYSLIQNQKQTHDCDECGRLNKSQKYTIWLQIAFMIVHMHQKGFIYRDLKPENILIDERGFAKLCDFGYCTKYEQNQIFKQVCGTLEYIPPELASGQGYDKTIDLYALGILLYELIANKSPFQGITLENMEQKKRQTIKFDSKLFTDKQKSLIQSLTKQKPQQRLGSFNSMNLFKHPFFDSEEVLPLVQQVIKQEQNYHLLFRLHFDKPKQLQMRVYKEGNGERFFQKPYNYLTPTCEIEEKIGPKFNSSF